MYYKHKQITLTSIGSPDTTSSMIVKEWHEAIPNIKGTKGISVTSRIGVFKNPSETGTTPHISKPSSVNVPV